MVNAKWEICQEYALLGDDNGKIMNMNDGSMIENKDRYTLTGYLKTKTFGSFASLF